MSNTPKPGIKYCCRMLEHFAVGILAGKSNTPPIETVDFLVSFDPPVITIKYCPFCGKRIVDIRCAKVLTRIDQ